MAQHPPPRKRKGKRTFGQEVKRVLVLLVSVPPFLLVFGFIGVTCGVGVFTSEGTIRAGLEMELSTRYPLAGSDAPTVEILRCERYPDSMPLGAWECPVRVTPPGRKVGSGRVIYWYCQAGYNQVVCGLDPDPGGY